MPPVPPAIDDQHARRVRSLLAVALGVGEGELAGEVSQERLDAAWSEDLQRARCLAGLVEDGLAVRTARGTYALP